MKLFVVVVAIAVAAYGYHRLATWAAARGWIYYRNSRGSLGSYGMAFIQATSMFSPEIEHVIEEQQAEGQRADSAESGATDPEDESFLGSVEIE